MKKIVLGLITLLSFASYANAQSFTVESDTMKATVYADLNIANSITNTTANQFKITWNIISSDFPASWTVDSILGICDNNVCRSNGGNALFTTTFTSDFYQPNVKGDFHLQLTHFDLPTVASGTHYLTVALKNGSDQKNITFLITKYPTGVTAINRSAENIVFYPNPASDNLNVVFDRDLDVKNIAVYNLIGKPVMVYKISGNSAKLDLSTVPSGIYFMKLSDAQGRMLATRKFTKQ